MQNIWISTKLLFLGIYIETIRKILDFYIKKKSYIYTSKKILFLSKICNSASLQFIKTELEFQ